MSKLNNDKKDFLSVVNLPDEFTITDPKEYIKVFRESFLRKAREAKQLTLKEASINLGIAIDELKRIESGNVHPQDMMILSKIAELYSIDYPSLLFLFKMATKPDKEKVEKLAACHDQKVDEETQKKLLEFVEALKDSSK